MATTNHDCCCSRVFDIFVFLCVCVSAIRERIFLCRKKNLLHSLIVFLCLFFFFPFPIQLLTQKSFVTHLSQSMNPLIHSYTHPFDIHFFTFTLSTCCECFFFCYFARVFSTCLSVYVLTTTINQSINQKLVVKSVLVAIKMIGQILMVTYLLQFMFAVVAVQLFKVILI